MRRKAPIFCIVLVILLLNLAAYILPGKLEKRTKVKVEIPPNNNQNNDIVVVKENPSMLAVRNPDPREVQRKIAEKYGIKAGPVFPNPANWTFAVYLDADNNLNDYGEYDFNEMGSVGSDESIGLRIVVLIDKYERRNPDEVGLWYIEQGDTWNDDYSWADEYWGEQNMGDPNTLIKFIEDILYNYSAYHYVLILWNHGGAEEGVCWDDTDGDHLYVDEVRDALEYIYEQYGVIFDVIGADACLMGEFFWEYTLYPYTKFVVHSQETEGAAGYAYDYILTNITNKLRSGWVPTPEYFADCIAYETIRYYKEAGDTAETQSAINATAAFYDLGPAVSKFANLLLRKYDTYATEIDSARSSATSFYYSYLRDLYHFAQNIYNSISDSEIQSAAQEVMQMVDKAVVHYYHSGDYPNAHGISVYFPTSSDGWDTKVDGFYSSYRTMWDDFARKYAASPYSTNFYDIWIADAIDDDGNGYYEYIKLDWDIDEDSGSGLSIYTKLYALDLSGKELRNIEDYEGSASETLIGISGTYTVTGRTTDIYEMELYNFVPTQANYGIRSEIYDTSDTLRYDLHYYTQEINDDLWDLPLEPDTVPPRLDISDPADGTVFSTTTFDITVIIDEVYLNQAVLYLNGSIVNTYTTEGTYTETVTVSQDGVYNITLWGKDNAGNENSVTIFVTVDTTPPTITITNPQDGSYLNTTSVIVSWSADDSLSGIDHYVIYVDGSVYANNIPSTTTSYTLTLSEGQHTIRVEVVDVAGNTNYDEISIVVDITAPTVNILSPTDGSTVTSTTVTVEWSGSDNNGIDHYEVRLDGGSWINVGTNTNHTFTDLSQGSHIVDVKAIDLAGNIGTDTVTFTVSLGSVNITSPTEDPDTGEAYVGGDSVVISWNASGSVDHYEIYVNDSYYGSTTGINYIISGLGEGAWNITIVAVYSDGSIASDYVISTVDLTPPSVSPDDNSVVADSSTTSVMISWSGSDSLSGIDHYEIYDGNKWVNVGTSTSYTIDTSSMPEGLYAIYIRAFDKAGLFSQSTILLIVDRTAPSLTILAPSDGAILGWDTIVVSWTASDNVIDIDHYEVSADGTNWINVGRETSYVFTLADGTYTIYVRAYDSAGNYAEKSVTITVDTVAPVVTITSPSDASTVGSSDVTVSWSSSATDVVYYLVRLDDGAWINVGTSTNYTFIGVSNGVHVAYAIAVDSAGHESIDYVVFIVDAAGKAIVSCALSSSENEVQEMLVEENIIANSEEPAIRVSLDSERAKNVTVISEAKEEIETLSIDDLASSENDHHSNSDLAVLGNIYRNIKLPTMVIALKVEESYMDTTWHLIVNDESSLVIRRMLLAYSPYIIIPPN